jgi:peptidoglycan biosynthesis protein MviN/MurJ (putative lipid II flippase)
LPKQNRAKTASSTSSRPSRPRSASISASAPCTSSTATAGPAIGSALFAYGKFGEVDANYLGMAIALLAALLGLQLLS